MSLDPYEQLGIERTATAEEIKRAYRSKVQAMHPDKHPGDPFATARFQQIQESYEILSDPVRRARFDAEGDVTGGKDLKKRAFGLLHMLLDDLGNQVSNGSPVDLVASVYDALSSIKTGASNTKNQVGARIKRIERALKRYKYKGVDESVIGIVFESKLDKLRAEVLKCDNALEEADAAKIIWTEYETLPEEARTSMGALEFKTFVIGNGGAGTWNPGS